MSERSDFFQRNYQGEIESWQVRALRYGVTVKQGEGDNANTFYIYDKGRLVASCPLLYQAARLAYALAATFYMPDPVAEALNSGDGTYRP